VVARANSGLGMLAAIHCGTSSCSFVTASSAKFSATNEIAFRWEFAFGVRTGTARAVRTA
jgi:hypothetical protein